MPLFLEGQDPLGPTPMMRPMGKPQPSLGEDFAYAGQHRWDGYMTATEFLLLFAILFFVGAWTWKSRKSIAKWADDTAVSVGAWTLRVSRTAQAKTASYAQRVADKADQKSTD